MLIRRNGAVGSGTGTRLSITILKYNYTIIYNTLFYGRLLTPKFTQTLHIQDMYSRCVKVQLIENEYEYYHP